VPQFLAGTNEPRHLFASRLPAPAYEQIAGFVAVIVLFGLFVEHVIFRTIEERTVRRWGMQV